MSDIPPRQQVSGSETIRMGQTEGLPHYDGPGEGAGYAPRGDAESGYGALARRQPDGGDPAMAILKAFQDYLEHERQRAQRRTSAAMIAFSALLVLVVVGFAAMWVSTMGRMQDSQSELMRAALAVREERQPAAPQLDVAAAIASAVAEAEKSAAERAAAEIAAAKAAGEADAARIAEARRQAGDDAAKAFEERLAAERKKAADEASAREAEMSKTLKALNEAVEAAKRDNEALRATVNGLAAAAPASDGLASSAPSAGRADLSENPPQGKPLPGKPLPERSASAGNPPVAKVGFVAPPITIKRSAPPKGYSQDTLAIPVPVGENGGRGQVNWRLLLPSELPAQ